MSANAQYLNIHHFTGNLGTDPQRTEGGLVQARIAVRNPNKKGADGKPAPDWFNVKAFGKTGELLMAHCQKGSPIGLSGAIGFDFWQDRETGEARRRAYIAVDRLDLLERKSQAPNTAEF